MGYTSTARQEGKFKSVRIGSRWIFLDIHVRES